MKTKKKYLFNMPYIGIDRYRDLDILYNHKGDFCIIISLLNPVLQYSADPHNYDLFHRLYVNMIKILGEGYVIQKQDVFSKTVYNASESTGYLQKKYDAHFHGRTVSVRGTPSSIEDSLWLNLWHEKTERTRNEKPVPGMAGIRQKQV